MAEESSSDAAETGAAMDYEEHEKTYRFFLALIKYSVLVSVAVLISMAFGFFTAAGFISSTILFVLICAIGIYLLR